jgi:hypothetical protein
VTDVAQSYENDANVSQTLRPVHAICCAAAALCPKIPHLRALPLTMLAVARADRPLRLDRAAPSLTLSRTHILV